MSHSHGLQGSWRIGRRNRCKVNMDCLCYHRANWCLRAFLKRLLVILLIIDQLISQQVSWRKCRLKIDWISLWIGSDLWLHWMKGMWAISVSESGHRLVRESKWILMRVCRLGLITIWVRDINIWRMLLISLIIWEIGLGSRDSILF